MEPFTGMMATLKQANKLPKQSTLWSSCETELSELMKQIDIMVHQKRMEWERENSKLQAKLEMRDQELVLQKATLEQKQKEIGQLKQHLQTRECKQRDTVGEYEDQLSRLRNEVAGIKREYDKLQRKHNKHVREMDREKSKNSAAAHDSASDLLRLNQKIQEYKQRSSEWELERRTYQKQIDSLESQRKTLAEKCEFIQQQSSGYQQELDKRRHILDNSQLNLKSQISQLESQLERARDTVNSQETQIERLKASLDDSISSHRKALDEKEDIVEDLKTVRAHARKLEEESLQFKLQVQSQEDLLRLADQTKQKLTLDLSRLQKALVDKDRTIQSLEDLGQKEQTDQVTYLKEELRNARTELKSHRKAHKKLEDTNTELGVKLEKVQREFSQLQDRFTHKSNEKQEVESLKLKHLNDELTKTKERLSLTENSRSAEVENLRKELMTLNFELEKKGKAYEELDQRATSSEERLQEKEDFLDKISAEREVINAQLEAVRLENQHLRQTLFRQTQKREDVAEGEGHIRQLHNIYSMSLSKLENENHKLKRDVEDLTSQIQSLQTSAASSPRSPRATARIDESPRVSGRTDRSPRATAHTDTTAHDSTELSRYDSTQTYDSAGMNRSPHDVTRSRGAEGAEKLVPQARFEQTISDYEAQLQQLNQDKRQLQEQLQEQSQTLRRLGRENLTMNDFMQGVDIIVTTPTKKPAGDGHSTAHSSMEPLEFPQLSPGSTTEAFQDDESVAAAISEQFLAEEKEKTRELERILDSHIEELSKATFKKTPK